MRLLAIETSCDETSAAIVEKKEKEESACVLSVVTASSLALQQKTGGIIPETAAREQVRYIVPVICQSLISAFAKDENLGKKESFLLAHRFLKEKIDAIGATIGPGLIGSLLVGVESAKTISYVFEKPLIPVNHLLAHLYANFIKRTKNASPNTKIEFPLIGLIASGGHTDLLLFKSHDQYVWLGGTLDDAAGEALDKIGRLLGISYPAGPEIEKRAKNIEKAPFTFKSPVINQDNLNFSFSGLKTEVLRFVQKEKNIDEKTKNQICFATQKAVVDVLVKKTINAAVKFAAKTILLGGGVAANEKLQEQLKQEVKFRCSHVQVFVPEKIFCTDNAAMIGTYALFHPRTVPWQKAKTQEDLYFA